MQRVEQSIRVNAPVDKVYAYWRNFENFPAFMENVEEVHTTDSSGKMSHWKLKGPLGTSAEFDAELVRDDPNRMIGWNSSGGSMQTSGEVTFTDLGNQMTEVHVVMQWYDTPGGPVGEAASRVLQNPSEMLKEDLQRFKDIVEGRVGSGLREP